MLAFDFGTKKIGVAVGNTVVRVAHALKTINARVEAERRKSIETLLDEWQPDLLLVGRPVHADGTEHEMTARADRFACELEHRFGLSVLRIEERFTTQAAAIELGHAGVRGDARRAVQDAVAAQLMLQAWFDEQ